MIQVNTIHMYCKACTPVPGPPCKYSPLGLRFLEFCADLIEVSPFMYANKLGITPSP